MILNQNFFVLLLLLNCLVQLPVIAKLEVERNRSKIFTWRRRSCLASQILELLKPHRY